METKKKLLKWVSSRTSDYDNVEVRNLSTSFSDGLAFCALVHSIDNNVFDYGSLTANEPQRNLQLAFDTAEKRLGIEKLLDVGDILDFARPDPMLITTYLLEFAKKYGGKKERKEEFLTEKAEGSDGIYLVSQKEIDQMIEKKRKERERKRKLEEDKYPPHVREIKKSKEKYKFSEQRNKKKQEVDTEVWREKTTRELDELYENFLSQINSPKYDPKLMNMDDDDDEISSSKASSDESEKEDEYSENTKSSGDAYTNPLSPSKRTTTTTTRKILFPEEVEEEEEEEDEEETKEIEKKYVSEEEEEVEVEEDLENNITIEPSSRKPQPQQPQLEEKTSYTFDDDDDEEEEEEEDNKEEEEEEEFERISTTTNIRNSKKNRMKSVTDYFSDEKKPDLVFTNTQRFSSKWDVVDDLIRTLGANQETVGISHRLKDLGRMKEDIERKYTALRLVQFVLRKEKKVYGEKIRDIRDYGKQLNFGSNFLRELRKVFLRSRNRRKKK